MNAKLSASMLAILLSLAGHAGAQAALKPPVNAKPGTGKTANVIMTDGGGACPIGPDGASSCTVTTEGHSSGGGGGGDAPCAMSGCSGSLPSYDPGRESGSGTSSEEAAARRAEAIKRCQDSYKNGVKTVEARFNNRTANCTAKNGGGIGPITYGIIDDALGVFGVSCYDRALSDRDTEMSNVNEANVACMQKAMNG